MLWPRRVAVSCASDGAGVQLVAQTAAVFYVSGYDERGTLCPEFLELIVAASSAVFFYGDLCFFTRVFS